MSPLRHTAGDWLHRCSVCFIEGITNIVQLRQDDVSLSQERLNARSDQLAQRVVITAEDSAFS